MIIAAGNRVFSRHILVYEICKMIVKHLGSGIASKTNCQTEGKINFEQPTNTHTHPSKIDKCIKLIIYLNETDSML